MDVHDDVTARGRATGRRRTARRGIAGFTGELIVPGDERYDRARTVWNAAVDRRPALIARAHRTSDVVAAIRFAREEGLPLSVRGGGHSTAGLAVADGALMLDLSPMKAVTVDPAAGVAVAAPGLTWAELDAATQERGLAVTGAATGSVGVAGMTLGGGVGRLDRLAGLACDNLIEAEVVTADGRVLTASGSEHPDLFWALRGGGGNFGVVTSLRLRVHPVATAYGGLLGYAFGHAAEVLRAYAHFSEHAPDTLALYAALITAPPLPFIPEGLRGQPVAGLLAFCFGTADEHPERSVAALRALLPPPAVDATGPMSYLRTQQMGEGIAPAGMHHYDTSEWLSHLDDKAIEALVDARAHATSPRSAIVLKRMGGATARVPGDATAFRYRQAAHKLHVHAEWASGEPHAHRAWARAARQAAVHASAGGGYVHFIADDEGHDRVRAAYGGNYARLTEVKAAYDPGNFFRINHNIAPHSQGPGGLGRRARQAAGRVRPQGAPGRGAG
jgi:FAD/FMN-containing dehydrogenase